MFLRLTSVAMLYVLSPSVKTQTNGEINDVIGLMALPMRQLQLGLKHSF